MFEIGTYKGETGWDGWIGTKHWVLFHRPNQIQVYQCKPNGAIIGDPKVINF